MLIFPQKFFNMWWGKQKRTDGLNGRRELELTGPVGVELWLVEGVDGGCQLATVARVAAPALV